MSNISIRKQLVQKMLLEGKSVKEIAIAAHCTMGYVYNIRSEMKIGLAIAKGQGEKVLVEQTPPLWKIILGGIGGLAFIFFVIILALSL